MSDSNVTKIAEPTIYFKAGAVIYSNGKMPKSLYIVKSGEVRLLKFVNQHLHVVQLCRAGEILNEVSVLLNKTSDNCAIAKTDTELISIETKDINQVIKKCPSWVPNIFKTLCERLVDSQEIITEHNLSSSNLGPGFVLSKDEEKKYVEALSSFNSN